MTRSGGAGLRSRVQFARASLSHEPTRTERMQLVGKRVTIVGMGVSGVAAAELCLRLGARCAGLDRRSVDQLGRAKELPIDLRLEGHGQEVLGQADLVVVSPGVPGSERFAHRVRPGTPVIGELELAARHLHCPVLAVGGTNGKSTTTELLAAMLREANLRVFCGGNLGTPLSCAVGQPWDAAVVEVSSFQLERAPTFRPRVSLLLNVSPDHLDRYASFEAYVSAKGNAFANQQGDDIAVIPTDDPRLEAEARRGGARLVRFGPGGAVWVEGQDVVEAAGGRRYALGETAITGRHNALNVAAAVAAARAYEVSPAAIERALRSYRPLPHRLQRVAEVAGATYYDDSKATNVGAAVAAIESVEAERVVLIAGGRDKGGSYAPLSEALARRGRAALLIGEAAERLERALSASLPTEALPDLSSAVRRAAELAQPGDAVLLSPACSSLDSFGSYAERGRAFSAAVRGLTASSSGGDEAGGGRHV